MLLNICSQQPRLHMPGHPQGAVEPGTHHLKGHCHFPVFHSRGVLQDVNKGPLTIPQVLCLLPEILSERAVENVDSHHLSRRIAAQ